MWNPRADWLNAAIDSAFNESRCRIEVVLVDDGSDSPPETWLLPHNAQRIRVVVTAHRGVTYARNAGLSHCSGQFVRFLDGDDLILPESTSNLVIAAADTPSLVTYGWTKITDAALKPRGAARSRLRGRIDRQTALGRFECTLPALLIPRKVIDRVGGFDERLIVQEDWDFVLRVSEAAPFRSIDRPVYVYRRNVMSATHRTARRCAVRSTATIIKAYLARHPELHGTRIERRLRAYAHFLIARLNDPVLPMRTRRFWRATAVDPLRGTIIAVGRLVSLGRTHILATARAVWLAIRKPTRI